MSALERLAESEALRIGDKALAQGWISDEDAAHSERCWNMLSRLAHIRSLEGPPPALAMVLEAA